MFTWFSKVGDIAMYCLKSIADVYSGTRDPYVVVDHGAGLIMIWRNGVQWNIGQDPDPRAFMTVDAGDFVLAVPDFSHYARAAPDMAVAEASEHAITSFQHELKLKKVVMKLSGKVRWQVGMVFERDLDNGRRSFDFIPHYDVTLRNPVHIKDLESQVSLRVLEFHRKTDSFLGLLRCLCWVPQQSHPHVHCSRGTFRPGVVSQQPYNFQELQLSASDTSILYTLLCLVEHVLGSNVTARPSRTALSWKRSVRQEVRPSSCDT